MGNAGVQSGGAGGSLQIGKFIGPAGLNPSCALRLLCESCYGSWPWSCGMW
jgi:hypothetical protein